MTHRPETAHAPTKTMKPVQVKKRAAQAGVSNWWYVVGFLVGVVAVFVFWWFIFPMVISLFY